MFRAIIKRNGKVSWHFQYNKNTIGGINLCTKRGEISNFQLSDSILREIFNHVQRSSTVEVEDEFNSDTEEADNDDELMDFKEFTEAFVAIALYTNSSPFVAAEQRIEKLFSQIFKSTGRKGSRRPKSAPK